MDIPDDNIDQIPEEDCIDSAIMDLIYNSPLGEEIPDQDFDDATSVLFDIISEFVDSGEMQEIPEHDEPEEKKQAWLKANLDKINSEFLSSVFLEADE
jgi:hypothetical protein